MDYVLEIDAGFRAMWGEDWEREFIVSEVAEQTKVHGSPPSRIEVVSFDRDMNRTVERTLYPPYPT